MRAYFHLPHRETEGVIIKHTSNTLPLVSDYIRICRRINRVDIKINDEDYKNKSTLQYDNNFIIAIDFTTDIKVTNIGE